MRITKRELDDLSFKVIGAAIEVHKRLGPGLLESVYQKCLEIELSSCNLKYKKEMDIPVYYRDRLIDMQFRCDFFVEDILVVELKAVSEVLPIHEAQVLNYINLLEVPKGILINFNVSNIFYQGQKTFVNKYYEMLI